VDTVRLQEIVRRQQAVIEELETRLQDLSDDDMEMGSTGLPTPRPVCVCPECRSPLSCMGPPPPPNPHPLAPYPSPHPHQPPVSVCIV
jgi:hypothetical protein